MLPEASSTDQPAANAGPTAPPAGRPLHATIRRVGWWVLLVGTFSGALIYVFTQAPTPAPDWTQDRGYNFAMERMGGKLSIYIAQFNQWLFSLWQGPQLGITVAVLAILVALCCFWLASFLAVPLPDEESVKP